MSSYPEPRSCLQLTMAGKGEISFPNSVSLGVLPHSRVGPVSAKDGQQQQQKSSVVFGATFCLSLLCLGICCCCCCLTGLLCMYYGFWFCVFTNFACIFLMLSFLFWIKFFFLSFCCCLCLWLSVFQRERKRAVYSWVTGEMGRSKKTGRVGRQERGNWSEYIIRKNFLKKQQQNPSNTKNENNI